MSFDSIQVAKNVDSDTKQAIKQLNLHKPVTMPSSISVCKLGDYYLIDLPAIDRVIKLPITAMLATYISKQMYLVLDRPTQVRVHNIMLLMAPNNYSNAS